jgi:site-specific recombinase XerD
MKKDKSPITEHLNDYLDWLEIEKGLSVKSQENYSRFLKSFLYWLQKNNLEDIKPHELTSDHIWKYRVFLARRYLSKNRNKPLKKTTQNYYLIALRSLLNYFAAKDITSLPAEKIKLAKDKKERTIKFLSLEQLEKLFSAPDTKKPKGLRDRAILEVLFSTGMRISELVSLNKEQIKIKENTKELELGIIGKGSRPRTIYFSERSLKWLKKYLETRKDKEKALFINYRRKKGSSRRLTPRSIEKMIKRYVIKTGLPITTTPHVLRHSFATDMLTQGVDLRTVQEFLGHKNIAATQIYTHVTSKRLRDVHRKFHGGKKIKKNE